MPKKKASVAQKPIKKAAKKTATVAKKTTSSTKKSAAKKSLRKTAAKPGPTSRTSAPAPTPNRSETQPPEVSLGRPLVTQEEKLYMLFHDDFLARQVFEFLRVQTVKELEEFSPQQIVHMMSKPVRMTVDRIRQRLAQMKRSLRDDEQYAAEFRQQMGTK